ncbi:MAG: DUF3316 domain-containing protein [Muribaculaceae bacterium]|nr:DUF3316 domain-containing protein [Muribaculaceae bacterium]
MATLQEISTRGSENSEVSEFSEGSQRSRASLTRLLVLLLALATIVGAAAQDGDTRRSVLTVEAGYGSVHDSYLTPITYDGLDLGLSLEHTHWVKSGRWLWQLGVGADYNYVENPAQNNDLHKLMGDLSFNMQRCWRGVITPRLNFSVGPMAQVRAGIVYDAVNSNNPVTVRAHVNAGAAGMAWWETRLGRKPVTLRYQLQLPVAGVFFAPEYDESYYEIYLGNRRNLAHLGWWGNRLDMSHYLGADLRLGKTILRLGYRTRLEHWTVNHLHVHDVTHAVVLGISL